MKMTVLKTALTLDEVESMGRYIKESDIPSLNKFYDSFYTLLEMPIKQDEVEGITLNRIDIGQDQYYHAIGMLMKDGRTFTVDDRHTLSGLLGDLDVDVELENIKRKARMFDTLTIQASSHRIKLVLTDEQRRYIGEVRDTAKLEQYLNRVMLEEDLKDEQGKG